MASGLCLLSIILASALPATEVRPEAFAMLTPAAGGEAVMVPVEADGSFQAKGLAAGRYRLSLLSPQAAKSRHDTVKNSISNVRAAGPGDAPAAPRDAGTGRASGKRTMASAAPAEGNQPGDAAGIAKIDGGMPNRISMSVSVGKATHALEIDGEPVEVEVGKDGTISGRAVAQPSPRPKAGGGRPATSDEAAPQDRQATSG